MAVNGIDVLLGNLRLITDKGDITEKYRTIAQYIGLVPDGKSHYNYFIPIQQDIVFLLRMSNHNNENEDLYNRYEKKGRPDARYIIYFQGSSYSPLFSGIFCEAKHYVYNYPTNGLDSEEDAIRFLSSLKELFIKGQAIFRGAEEEPRQSNNDIISQWNRTVDKNIETNESKNMKNNVVKINENTLRQIVAESVKKVLKETELDYDMDNFSGRWSRGPRYNIYIGDTLMYRDVPEETADRVWDEVCRKAEMWGEEPRCEEI